MAPVSGQRGTQVVEPGVPFDAFLLTVTRLQNLWSRQDGVQQIPEQLTSRLKEVGHGLRILVVAEDWCVDSANTVPLLARLAGAAGVDLRILHRQQAQSLLDAHRTRDGRTATPLVVMLRDGRDAGAWVERPAALRDAFARMLTSDAAAEIAAHRQAWYDADHGRSALTEIVELAESSWRAH
jgi:hypothetical protein